MWGMKKALMTGVCNFCECIKPSILGRSKFIMQYEDIITTDLRASSLPRCLVILWWAVLSDPEGLGITNSGPCQHSTLTLL